MKPTQQEAIDVAREAGFGIGQGISAIRINGYADDLLRLAELLLERFGAGGGEPVAWLNPYGGVVQVRATGHEKEHFTIPLYTHPSPTDLRVEYLRGLEDAAKVCETFNKDHQDCNYYDRAMAEAIRTLKGKQ